MAEKIQPGVVSGGLRAVGLRFGIVVSRFNNFITERLSRGGGGCVGAGWSCERDVDRGACAGSVRIAAGGEEIGGDRASMTR